MGKEAGMSHVPETTSSLFCWHVKPEVGGTRLRGGRAQAEALDLIPRVLGRHGGLKQELHQLICVFRKIAQASVLISVLDPGLVRPGVGEGISAGTSPEGDMGRAPEVHLRSLAWQGWEGAAIWGRRSRAWSLSLPCRNPRSQRKPGARKRKGYGQFSRQWPPRGLGRWWPVGKTLTGH